MTNSTSTVTCSDTTHTATVAAGQTVALQIARFARDLAVQVTHSEYSREFARNEAFAEAVNEDDEEQSWRRQEAYLMVLTAFLKVRELTALGCSVALALT